MSYISELEQMVGNYINVMEDYDAGFPITNPDHPHNEDWLKAKALLVRSRGADLYPTKACEPMFNAVRPEVAVDHGYAEFNGFPHACIMIPDGGFTVSARTSEGKRITFSFMPYRAGGAPQCVDVCYHDGPVDGVNNQGPTKLFHLVGFAMRKPDIDTRKINAIGIACVLMDNEM